MPPTHQVIDETLLTNLGFLLGKSAQIKDRFLDQYLAVEDITSSQAKVLFTVFFQRNQRSSDISRILNVDSSAITRMLDRLEKKQLIQRTADPEDRRSSLIELTDKGHATTLRALPLANQAIDRLTECLTHHERDNLQDYLAKIVDAFYLSECQLNEEDRRC
ncbi:MarR family winged helix-turn-helix transcriptional regulator [Marinomonas pollencensis]|uniref:DNA-binding MarR family transcriptional regulator n=1 Tax=Marinomonas pollencensis TaxID=491954 RepID=A0A3E0DKK1_9GAMM|nr:MarR family transcriptional regulator [Marinomonas pollencensis]REG83250.1 DNA-binding MarR family transcriptional regulator [Marinomonas pollencensis]